MDPVVGHSADPQAARSIHGCLTATVGELAGGCAAGLARIPLGSGPWDTYVPDVGVAWNRVLVDGSGRVVHDVQIAVGRVHRQTAEVRAEDACAAEGCSELAGRRVDHVDALVPRISDVEVLGAALVERNACRAI